MLLILITSYSINFLILLSTKNGTRVVFSGEKVNFLSKYDNCKKVLFWLTCGLFVCSTSVVLTALIKTSPSFNIISDLPFEYIPISCGSAKTPLDLLLGYVPSKFLIGKFCWMFAPTAKIDFVEELCSNWIFITVLLVLAT